MRRLDLNQKGRLKAPVYSNGARSFMPVALQNNEAWRPISTAPFDSDLELAVINSDGIHALVFPCRRIFGGWLKAETTERVDVNPTHWRHWI